MKYEKILHARFVSRPNRFIAEVIPEERTGGRITVHVKTTGRCRELLVPVARVISRRQEIRNAGRPMTSSRYIRKELESSISTARCRIRRCMSGF